MMTFLNQLLIRTCCFDIKHDEVESQQILHLFDVCRDESVRLIN